MPAFFIRQAHFFAVSVTFLLQGGLDPRICPASMEVRGGIAPSSREFVNPRPTCTT